MDFNKSRLLHMHIDVYIKWTSKSRLLPLSIDKKSMKRNFPGGPMVKNPPVN